MKKIIPLSLMLLVVAFLFVPQAETKRTDVASADVSLVKTLTTSGPFTSGQSLSYTLFVANGGPDTATNIQVTDTPTNLTITNVSGGGCAALPCTIASLASGANTTITVTATINAPGAFDNSASVSATEADPDLTNNTDSTGNGGITGASADVSLVKTLTTSGPFTSGQSISYTITVANAGPSTATSIQVTDTPTNLSITNVTGSGCAALPCTIASLASGANTAITVTAMIDAAGAFDNSANANATESDPNPSDNTDNTGNGGTAAASADVSLNKTLDTAGPYVTGQSISYTITVANAGPSTATSIQVTDTPTNLSITNVTGSGCAALPCTIASLASGANTGITVTATINTAGAFDNSATATAAESDPNPSDNTDNTANGGSACSSTPVVTSNGDSGAGTLRQAISDACSGATITFNTAGVFATSQTITLTSGELSVDRDLTINGPTSSGVTISGNSPNVNASRIFNVNASKSLTFSNLTIANGKAAQGGGIFNAGTLTITNSTITGNTTPNGADTTGSSTGGDGGDGGGIYSTGTLRLINSTVGENQTGRGGDVSSGNGNGGNGGRGAGIYSTGSVRLTNTTITRNTSGRYGLIDPNGSGVVGVVGAGGVHNNGGTLITNNTIVADNHDGFANEDDIHGPVDPTSSFNFIGTLTGFTGISNGVNGNQIGPADTPLSPGLASLADNGGPTKTYLPQNGSLVLDAGNNSLAVDQNSLALTNDQRGTGFPRIINGTVEIGSVETLATPPSSGADLTVTKSADQDQVVPDRDITYTIVVTNGGGGTASSVTLSDNLPSATSNSDPDNPTLGAPLTFVSLTAPGWTCTTPAAGSPGSISCSRASLIGGGTSTLTLVAHVPSNAVQNSGAPFITNVVFVDSPDDGNSENNEGLANTELISCLTDPIVTNNLDSGPGSLRRAIADACVGSTITFDTTQFTGPITLTSAELLINKDLTIQGPANLLTVQRSSAGATPNFRVFEVIVGHAVAISNLTIANGNESTAGGILNGGNLTLTQVAVSGNTASGSGGGIGNAASGVVRLTSSIVSENNAVGSFGGGIFSNGGAVIATNSTISGNRATAVGGGIFANGGTLTLTNSTITNNRSDSDNSGGEQGGGLSSNGATSTLKNTIVAANFRGTGTTRDDINGALDSAGSFNLIGDGTNMTGITNGTNGNQVGSSGSPINALLGVLANNGGLTQTHLLLPASPAINAGSNANLPADTFDLDGDSNTAEPLPVDQRGVGFNRIVGTTVDIGAVETNYAISATAGTPQSATINSAFVTALKATVTESGNLQNAIPVTFTAPASGARGTFVSSATVDTNVSGIATAPTFTANGIAGSYNVIASIGSGLPTATFALTNNPAATTTALTSGTNPSNLNQSVTFTATVTSGSGTPTGTVTFKDGGSAISCSNAGGQTLNGGGVATCQTSTLVSGVHTITADYLGDGNFLPSTGTLSGGQRVGTIIRFSSSNFTTTEGAGSTTITVKRIGDLTSAVTVDFATPDDSAAFTFVPCSTANGVASSRCDFETGLGALRWAAGDGADKTFAILINQDNFVEGPETVTLTLSNLTGGAGFDTPGAATATSTLTITDDVTEPAGNAIDDTDTFVRQHYRDFLNRVPDPSGLAFWKDNIDKCNDPARRPAGMTLAQCIEIFRINTSAAFFLSIEFQNTGYFVERMHKAGFGDISPPTVPVPVTFTNLLADTQQIGAGVIVGQGNWRSQLDQNKAAFALAFVQRPGFLNRYPAITSPTAFVDSLNANAGNVLLDSERSALISELAPNPADPALRADVLRKIAENQLLQQREFNRAFVLMQYFGYLRRNPNAAPEATLDFSGFNFWLNKLNSFNGDFVQAEMVKAFINSTEYRRRFGP